jgi:hypothetical protein
MDVKKAMADDLLKKKMSRRDLFVKTAQVAIPTLGVIGLTLSGFTGGSGGSSRGCTGCTLQVSGL